MVARKKIATAVALVVALSVTGAVVGAVAGDGEPRRWRSPNTRALDLPFSDAVEAGGLVFLSGQLGNVPGQSRLVEGGIRAETRQTMENIRTILDHYGLGMDALVKCTVMMADIGEWPAMNEVYRSFFAGDPPARSAFAAEALALGARLEIECIAAR